MFIRYQQLRTHTDAYMKNSDTNFKFAVTKQISPDVEAEDIVKSIMASKLGH